jgi:PII-like signaling protein
MAAEQVLCRFDVSNQARHGLGSLYEWIIHTAHKHRLQGGSVFIGIHGLDDDGTPIEPRTWSLTEHVPVAIEVVDDADRITELLRTVEPQFHRGTIMLRAAHVVARGMTTRLPARVPGVTTMKKLEDGVLLRIFVGERDRDPEDHRPLYETLVRRAHDLHLAGATVMRGHIGFGRHSRVHSAKFLEQATDLPVVVEVIDSEAKVQSFLPVVEELVKEGLVTIEAVRLARYP